MAKDSKKRTAAYAAGGAVVGAAAMPVRAQNNAKTNPYKDLKPGVHDVPLRTAQKASRRTGPRLQNRKYTAAYANHIRDNGGEVKPTKVQVYSDGSYTQSDGAHRIWARSMQGAKTVPVEVEHLDQPRPAGRRAAHQLLADLQTAHHRARLKRDTDIGQKKIDSLASKLHPMAAKYNMKHAAKGNQNPLASFNGKTMSTRELRTKQGAYIAGGIAAGVGAKKLKDKLSKSDTTSAFGVDHGVISKARNGTGVTRGKQNPITSMTERGGKGEYYRPTDEQVQASRARRAQQKVQGQHYQENVKPNIRTGGGKRIPWAEHRAGMGTFGPKRIALYGGGALVAAGALEAYNHREKLQKSYKDHKDETVGAALGGTAGYAGAKGGLDTAGVAGKITLKNRRAKRGESPNERKIWNDYATKNNVKYVNGKPAHWSAYAKYPKSLPDWKLQRAVAYKGSPKVEAGVLAGGAALGAAAGALSTKRHRHD